MLKKIHNKFFLDLLKLPTEDVSSLQIISDRLLKMLNVSPIYNTPNPFEWMENIAIQGKTNFFEKRVGEYSNKANPDIKDNYIGFDEDF